MYYQCTLQRPDATGIKITQGWIEEKGAKKGCLVELKGDDSGLWLVTEVGNPGLTADQLLKLQEKSHKGFPSIGQRAMYR